MGSKFRYLTKKDIANSDEYPFTMGQLSGYLLNRRNNGLQKAVRKIGKNIYFREDLFDDWMESHEEEESKGGE